MSEDDSGSPRTEDAEDADEQRGSYRCSASGTLLVGGFDGGRIGRTGIELGRRQAVRVPMAERLVLLSRLGSGASGAVYKALDLQTRRLVAVKMVSYCDRCVATAAPSC